LLRPACAGRFFVLIAGDLPLYLLGMTQPDTAKLKDILQRSRVIAVVGVSLNPVRPSFFVARYLSLKGYRVIPVNPGVAGQTLFGEVVRASLSDCPPDVDMVDIFRQSEHVPPIVDAALAQFPALRTIWMQIGVSHAEAAAKARAHGVDVVENLCPKMEYQRLFGELRMGGINTGVISSRL
jgi:predicted CoA-binding protein